MSRCQTSNNTPRRNALIGGLIVGGLTAASLLAPVAHATGTTGDFGKDLSRTTTLHHFQVDKEKYVGQRFEFNCPATNVRDKEISLIGTDVYPANSPICVAALHAGAVGDAGGPIMLQLNPGRDGYKGSIQHDIESKDFPGTGLSIMFVTDTTRAELDKVQQQWAPRLKWKDKFSQTGLANIRLTGQRFAFDCPSAPGKLAGRSVYGTDSYPLSSYVCMAAVHAGQISKAGGPVLIQMDPAIEGKFAGSNRNGIESKNGPNSPRSITFPGAGDQAPVVSVDVGGGFGKDADYPAEVKKKARGMLGKSAKALFD